MRSLVSPPGSHALRKRRSGFMSPVDSIPQLTISITPSPKPPTPSLFPTRTPTPLPASALSLEDRSRHLFSPIDHSAQQSDTSGFRSPSLSNVQLPNLIKTLRTHLPVTSPVSPPSSSRSFTQIRSSTPEVSCSSLFPQTTPRPSTPTQTPSESVLFPSVNSPFKKVIPKFSIENDATPKSAMVIIADESEEFLTKDNILSCLTYRSWPSPALFKLITTLEVLTNEIIDEFKLILNCIVKFNYSGINLDSGFNSKIFIGTVFLFLKNTSDLVLLFNISFINNQLIVSATSSRPEFLANFLSISSPFLTISFIGTKQCSFTVTNNLIENFVEFAVSLTNQTYPLVLADEIFTLNFTSVVPFTGITETFFNGSGSIKCKKYDICGIIPSFLVVKLVNEIKKQKTRDASNVKIIFKTMEGSKFINLINNSMVSREVPVYASKLTISFDSIELSTTI
ncbi:hypothetical protein RCL1_004162 [Eukaryota sp. TZLM3-RCL]